MIARKLRCRGWKMPAAVLALDLIGVLASTVLVPADTQASHRSSPAGKPSVGSKGPAFVVRPYLQLPAPTAMTVMWETSQKLPGQVEFGRTKAMGGVARASKPSTLHEVRIRGLSPQTTYYYRVRSGPLASVVSTFTTAPSLGTKRWRLAVYGDSRTNATIHRKIAEQIARAKVDLMAHTGDLVLNGKNRLAWRLEFFEPLGKLAGSVPLVSTLGNHECDADNYFSYLALPGNKHYFGFDYANAHFVFLDSNGWIEKGRGSQQYQWLAAHLQAKRSATWTFVVFHHPLFSAHATRPINALRWDWAPLLLDPANRVDGVLAGHDHFYARNYRMGYVGARPQAGVLFLTTGGGGASLYRCKERDYVARAQSTHHFSLFDFNGDRVTLSAIDQYGIVFDRYVLTKQSTPAEEYCAYEIELLKQSLRDGLEAAVAVPVSRNKVTKVDGVLRVPTFFRVPITGQLRWQLSPGWKMPRTSADFNLEPGQALEIPLRAEIAAGGFHGSPLLTIAFTTGKFRNRTVGVYPFKLAGPEVIVFRTVKTAVKVDGQLKESAWRPANGFRLLGLPPRGEATDSVEFLADKDWLYVGARLNAVSGSLRVKTAGALGNDSRFVLFDEHLRLSIWDGKQVRTFALSPKQDRYCRCGPAEDPDTPWRGAAAADEHGWSVEMAIPRKLFPDLAKVRLNVLHHRRQAKGFADYELCPTYGMGNNPGVIPDWKPVENVHRYARVLFQ